MNHKWQNALKTAFDAPAPKEKEEFLAKLRPREVGTLEMLFTQTSHIRKSVWILSFAILLLAIEGVIKFPENIIRLLMAVTPVAATLGILETNRSYTHQMSELEQVTRFSLRSVIYARMLMIGMVHLVVIFISGAVLAASVEISMFLITAQILTPYLITTTIGLRIERTAYGRNHPYLAIAVAAAVSVLALFYNQTAFSQIAILSGEQLILIAVVLFALTIRESFKTLQFTEVYP